MKYTAAQDAAAAQAILNALPPEKFADAFVELRMQFARNHCQQLTMSTAHGIDFFQNVIDACEGRLQWLEPGEPRVRSIYGDNFRKLIANANHGD